MMKVIKEHVTEITPDQKRARYEAKISARKQVAESIIVPLPDAKRGSMPELDIDTAYKYASTLLEIAEWLAERYIRNG